uniref:DUF6824 domain-containing protein n=1 Tax=Cyclophora tenuis TaxID=216820 RepID=A0A7S1CW35_CYCTE|mmetsp:Transcript_11807/g.19996  ORF Transcript_11807/g.19996 Transcript_11807/m.19996 type:complete len:175 (+) Transcript_11807:647-1171(+)|eukprot:CAMPEP_0116544644 /NCGR_PEP_ID=MMETSP0397-20121206/2231_1 /TAXON_ID=216820 /ORGANISM="Cyclophora tenuis, Strain ECT3854" /LENGTH=174 /DNA_ID=CAMNT_0004068877 /DNA_START=1292 /DNA_END=1816 /DNA_ORIENTATION=-
MSDNNNSDDLSRIQYQDVLCSRYPSCTDHPGNVQFSAKLTSYLRTRPWLDVANAEQRMQASREVVQMIRSENGRFLAKALRNCSPVGGNMWLSLEDEWAVCWVSSALIIVAGGDGSSSSFGSQLSLDDSVGSEQAEIAILHIDPLEEARVVVLGGQEEDHVIDFSDFAVEVTSA